MTTGNWRDKAAKWVRDDFTPRKDPPKMLLWSAVLLVGAGLVVVLLRPDVWPLGVGLICVAGLQVARAARGYLRRTADDGGRGSDGDPR